jgi:hypothetical protein
LSSYVLKKRFSAACGSSVREMGEMAMTAVQKAVTASQRFVVYPLLLVMFACCHCGVTQAESKAHCSLWTCVNFAAVVTYYKPSTYFQMVQTDAIDIVTYQKPAF